MKVDPLDKLFSQYIRKRAMVLVSGCERCLSSRCDIVKDNGDIFLAWQQLQCVHLTGRWQKSTRWDEDNAIGACGGCHRVFHRDHTALEDFIERHLGQERYALLKARARTPARYLDKEAIRIYYQAKIKALEE